MTDDHCEPPGCSAPAPRVRSLPVHLAGTPLPGKPSHNAKALVGEYGWLTPIRKSKGDPQTWFWRCRCGDETVLKRAVDVRSSVARGRTPACKSCAKMLGSEARMRREP